MSVDPFPNNNTVSSWLLNSISKEIAASVIFAENAAAIWSDLHTRFEQNNGPDSSFQLKVDSQVLCNPAAPPPTPKPPDVNDGDPVEYKSITSRLEVLLTEQGVKGFFRGWVPSLLGYSAQGADQFGFYEFFKKYYSDLAGPENAAKYKTLISLASSAPAEVIADVALCPFEAVKVRVQTQPGFARSIESYWSSVRKYHFGNILGGIEDIDVVALKYYLDAQYYGEINFSEAEEFLRKYHTFLVG